MSGLGKMDLARQLRRAKKQSRLGASTLDAEIGDQEAALSEIVQAERQAEFEGYLMRGLPIVAGLVIAIIILRKKKR